MRNQTFLALSIRHLLSNVYLKYYIFLKLQIKYIICLLRQYTARRLSYLNSSDCLMNWWMGLRGGAVQYYCLTDDVRCFVHEAQAMLVLDMFIWLSSRLSSFSRKRLMTLKLCVCVWKGATHNKFPLYTQCFLIRYHIHRNLQDKALTEDEGINQ